MITKEEMPQLYKMTNIKAMLRELIDDSGDEWPS
jgi:hypothetical protein